MAVGSPVPPHELARWTIEELGSGASIVASDLLAQGREGGPWRLTVDHAGGTVDVLLKAARPDPDEAARFATSAAALELAAANGVPAPRPIAFDLESRSGWLAALMELLPGSSRVERSIPPARLRALGAAAAHIHGVRGTPSEVLPVRRRSLDGYDLDAGGRPGPSSSLLAKARGALAATAPSDEPHGFVHGDLWQGNTLWDGDRYTGAVDWDFAGFGPAGIDLGSLRSDVAILHGSDTADDVLAGWRDTAGREPANLAWWDLVAGCATPDDLGGWLPNFHAQGRTDLDLATVTRRRDDYVRDALDRLG
jgi:Ser/Thr protein kinase RdoA (MazF antagonist)